MSVRCAVLAFALASVCGDRFALAQREVSSAAAEAVLAEYAVVGVIADGSGQGMDRSVAVLRRAEGGASVFLRVGDVLQLAGGRALRLSAIHRAGVEFEGGRIRLAVGAAFERVGAPDRLVIETPPPHQLGPDEAGSFRPDEAIPDAGDHYDEAALEELREWQQASGIVSKLGG
jgi:hypothetical protein